MHRPDVVLMDLRMPEVEGVEAVSRIRQIDPHAKVIVLTTYDADEDIARALQEKLGVTSRTEAVRVATRRGLVRFD